MATASPPRSRSPGRCRPGYLRGLPDGQAEGASLALGLPVAAAKWLSQLGCPAQDRLPPRSRPEEIAWQPQLRGTPRGWTGPPATTGGCLLDGEPMPRSLKGRGEKQTAAAVSVEKPQSSGWLPSLPESWAHILGWI